MGHRLTIKETQVANWFIEQQAALRKKPCELINVSLKDLASLLGLDPSNLSKYIKSLEKKGILESGFRPTLQVLRKSCYSV